MAKKQEKTVDETLEEKELETPEEEEKIPTEEEFKNAKTSEEKLGLMKKLLANQKVAEPAKQKLVYKAMENITVVRN